MNKTCPACGSQIETEEDAPEMKIFYYDNGIVRASVLPEETVRVLMNPERGHPIYFFAYPWEMKREWDI